MTAWLVRGGRNGEWESWALDNSVAGGGFSQVPDISGCTSREEVTELIASALIEKSHKAHINYGGQLWTLRSRIQVGDIVVLPLRTRSRRLAMGRCTSGYNYLPSAEPGKRHSIGVQWLRTDVARSDLKQDLLFSLGAYMTICEIARNDAETRLAWVLEGGKDPGASLPESRPSKALPTDATPDSDPDQVEIETIALDSIRTRLIEAFQSHQLASLVAAILTTKGLICVKSDPGPDQGIDIVAGSGPLGLDSPRIVVQCKSGDSAVDVTVLRTLQGALGTIEADQALLVAFGGLTRKASELLTNQQYKVKVWDADEVLNQLLEVYDSVDEEIKEMLPLKRIWTLTNPEE